MMDDSHDVKTTASSNNEETDSDRKTPSSNSDAGSLRADTPGPMPKYIYTKKDLVEIAESPASKRRPQFLQKDFDTTDGKWDPERWTRSFDKGGDGSRGNSPITLANRDRKRPVESERDPYKRRPPADPKARLKEEDEDLGIVLSPQRRSFGTGCHVTTTKNLRPGSPPEPDPRDRRDRGGERRIGSGRIQIDRERDGRDRDMRDRDSRDRDPRERDPRDRDPRERDTRDRDPRERDPREREHRDIRDRDRDMRDPRDRDHRDIRDRDIRDRDPRDRDRDDRRDPRDFRDSRGRFDRDDRRGGGGGFDRNDYFRRNDRDFRDRDMRDRRYGGRGYRRHEEEEPEWFSGGPTSQSDTIELRGFEDPKKEREREREEEEIMEEEMEERRNKQKKRGPPEGAQVPEGHPQNALPVQSFTDLMQGQQSQGIRSDSPSLPYAADFDFNQIFNIENIPGLSDLPLFGNTEETDNQPVSGSKFSRWFQGDSGAAAAAGLFGNHQDSRRSSINEGEFGYLNDLVGGQRTPSGPSPPPNMMGHMMQSNFLAQFPRYESNDPQSKQQTNILELLHNAKMNAAVSRGQDVPMMVNNASDSRPTVGRVMASDLERDLKAMILPGAGLNQKLRSAAGKNTPPPMPKLGLGMPGKITTVAELEANLKEMDMSNNNRQHRTMPAGMGPGGNMGLSQAPMGHTGHTMAENLLPNVLPGHTAQHAHHRQNAPQRNVPHQPSPTDMTAFNKLLGMMKQAGTLGQAQKEMQKVAGEGRMSPHQQQMAPPPAPVVPGNQQKDILQMLTQQNIQHQIQQQLQHQQVKIKQHQQQQHQMQEQILKFVKQNPAIITPKPPASPCPPAALAAVAATLQPPALGSHLQPPASPRCPSPGIPGLLQQPASSTPNAPSPIMFGSQPPMHLTAPSPIHASQIQPPASPNTLQVTGQANKQIARVPSPQELVAHTQAIMQNALIKKQLEDQKERFMRKQHDGPGVKLLKSPNAPVTAGAALQFQFPPVSVLSRPPGSSALPQVNTNSGSTIPTQQPKVLPAFTPTSVIRKMANEKAEAKENGRDEDGERNTPTGMRPGVPQVVLQADTPPHPGTPGSVSSDGGVTINVPSSLQHQLQQIQDPQQQQALINAHMLQQQQQPQPCMPGQPQPVGMDPKRRPLIGQGTMQSLMQAGLACSAPNQQQTFSGGRPIVKGGSIVSPPSGTPPVATVQPQTHQPQPGRPLQAGAGAQGVPTNMSIAHTTAVSQQQRAIVGSQAAGNVATVTTAAGATDINKLLEQQRLQQQRISPTSPNMQRQAAAAAANPTVLNAQLAAAAAARLPGVQAGIVRPGIPAVNSAVANAAAANAILLQRMMQSGGIQNPVRTGLAPQAVNINQINQLNQLAALQAQAAQPRPAAAGAAGAAASIDPRLQVTRPGVYPNQLMAPNQPGLPSNSLSAAALNAAISRALSPQPQMAAPIASLTNMKPDGNNLSKWFGNDLFKQQLPNMPPLPAQGQKVLTVDEIERRSQTVTN